MQKNIEQKLDTLDNRLDSIDTHLAVYNEQLKIHIKRTNILEEEIKPITQHVQQIKGSFKLIAFLIGIAGVVAAIMKSGG